MCQGQEKGNTQWNLKDLEDNVVILCILHLNLTLCNSLFSTSLFNSFPTSIPIYQAACILIINNKAKAHHRWSGITFTALLTNILPEERG